MDMTPKPYWTDKKVLVTGGAGFIGSYLVEELVADGAEVTVADDLSRGSLRNLAANNGRVSFEQVDLRYLDRCEAVCRDKEIVMNLAAPAYGVQYSSQHHGEMLTNTILIGFNMLEASRRMGVDRFLVVSSSCVYPDDAPIPTSEEWGWNGVPELVNLGYGWAKRMVELQAQFYAREYGMKIAIARPFNAYGPREGLEGEKANVVPALITRAFEDRHELVVWGTGKQTRSLVHARDFARGLKLITEHYPAADPVNVGHDRETPIHELAERILRLTGSKARLVFDTTKPEGAFRKSCDVRKLRTVTHGFAPEITLDEGLEEMIEYCRSCDTRNES
jgi:nucleoside-diphosphate-sugar epimerase